MSNTIRLKRRTSGQTGAPSTLANAEPAYNEVDDVLYYGKGTGGANGTATTIIPIAGPGAFVDRTSAQSIAGVKTFTSSPVAPTPVSSDNSTQVATTAFVQTLTAAPVVPANTVRAGPASGANAAATWRALVAADIPSLTASKISDFSSAADARISAQRGIANGVASLDANGLVPASQLPSYVDDVKEYASLSSFPATGESDKIYFTDDTGKIYRWGGSTYIEISASPGSTDAVPEGATNKYFTETRVLASILAGLTTTTATPITASDSVLSAIGKLQGQTSARLVSANNLSDLNNVVNARTNLGLGSMAIQNATSVAITGGSIDGIVFDGGSY